MSQRNPLVYASFTSAITPKLRKSLYYIVIRSVARGGTIVFFKKYSKTGDLRCQQIYTHVEGPMGVICLAICYP